MSVLLCLLLGASLGAAQETVHGVAEMTHETIGRDVVLRGVVVYASAGSTVWLHDGTGAVSVHVSSAALAPGSARPAVGDSVSVRGEVRPCQFRPCIAADELTRLGAGKLPEPLRPPLRQVLEGRHYGQWVEVEAPVRQVARRGGEWWLRLGSGESPAVAVMPAGPPPAPGQRVRWRGVAAAAYDGGRHYLGLLLYVPSAEFAEAITPPPRIRPGLLPIGEVGTTEALPGDVVRIRGRVTYLDEGRRFYVEDSTGAVIVLPTPAFPLTPGDAVEVIGRVRSDVRGPALEEPTVRLIRGGGGGQTAPVAATVEELALGRHARRLVQLEGLVQSRTAYGDYSVVSLQGTDAPVEVYVPRLQNDLLGEDVVPGARVRVTGVADVVLWETDRIGAPYRFSIGARGPDDVVVTQAGAFWTAERLGLALGAVVLGGLAVGLWAWTLRRRVRARTAELRLERDHAETLRREAQAADRAKSAFLANMSHEIRTPLTAIIGFAQLLEESGGDPDLSGRIERAGLRLLGTINSVLTFARLEAGRTDVRLEPAVLAVLARHAVDSLRPLALTKRLSLALAVDAGAEGARALVDPSHLGRVLDNLIGNAVKFTEKGAVAVRVRADRSRVWVEVSDTGPGIEAGFLPRIFGEFEQATTGERRRFEGSGLGLAITKRLVEAMGGVIEVETVVGRGSSFTVGFARLPDARSAPSGDAVAWSPSPT